MVINKKFLLGSMRITVANGFFFSIKDRVDEKELESVRRRMMSHTSMRKISSADALHISLCNSDGSVGLSVSLI